MWRSRKESGDSDQWRGGNKRQHARWTTREEHVEHVCYFFIWRIFWTSQKVYRFFYFIIIILFYIYIFYWQLTHAIKWSESMSSPKTYHSIRKLLITTQLILLAKLDKISIESFGLLIWLIMLVETQYIAALAS
jgi:hypothetical protein